MAAAKPWMTSTDLIESVKRKMSVPLSQSLFTDTNILSFANEEMAIAQVPSVLSFHEEYFVFIQQVPITSNTTRYPIPDRALGMRLRDVKWLDSNNNLFDMTRVPAEDKAFWQADFGSYNFISKYYLEGNDLCLLPQANVFQNVTLVFYYFLRPNQLVANARASIIKNFINNITVLNAGLSAGDTLTIKNTVFTASNGTPVLSSTPNGIFTTIDTTLPHGLISGQEVTFVNSTTSTPSLDGTYTATVLSPTSFNVNFPTTVAGTDGIFTLTDSEFLIGANDIATATNLTVTINNNGIVSATNGTPSTSLVTLRFNNILDSQATTTSNTASLLIPSSVQTIEFDQVPATYQDPNTFVTEPLFVDGSQIDFLQTKPGHRTYGIDVTIPANGISGTFVSFNLADVPTNMLIGDYMCLVNECIIPQIPPDLHNELAERTCARMLAAMGDQAGLQVSSAKITDMEKRQSTLLDNRVESSPQKIVARNSILRYQTSRFRRFI